MLRRLGLRYVVVAPGSSFRGLHESLVNHLGNTRARDGARAARGARGRHRARLCARDRRAARRRRALQCRRHACQHGGVQCLVRPRADADPRRHRPARFRNAGARRWTGCTPPPTKARSCATTPNGTTRRCRSKARSSRCCAAFSLRPPRRKRRSTSRSISACRKTSTRASSCPPVERFKPGVAPLPDPSTDRRRGAASGARPNSRSCCAGASRAASTIGSGASNSPKRSAASSSATSRSRRLFRPIIRCTGPIPRSCSPGRTASNCLQRADVILSLDWWDQATLFKQCWPDGRVPAKVIRCSLDSYLHRGWTRDHLGLSPVDIDMLCAPDRAVPALLEGVKAAGGAGAGQARARAPRRARSAGPHHRAQAAARRRC